MYIQRRVQSDELTLRNSLKRQEPLNYDNALPDLSDSKTTGNDNGVSLGVVRFCIVLGGILFVVIITGIVTYIYRKKLLSSKPKKPPRTNTISYILDYYEHDYSEPEKDKKDEKYVKDVRDVRDMRDVRDVRDDIIKIDISDISVPTLNEGVRLPITTSQISGPMPNSSVSIYNKERANSLASNLASRAIENTATAYTTITPPVPALIPVNHNQLKATSNRSEMKTISNATFDNIIPEMFDDSTDNFSAAPIDINAKWFTYPIDSPTIPLTPARVPKVTSDNSRPSSDESEAVPNIPEVYDRKSKRNLRIRIDTFDQFKLNEDKPSFTSVGAFTYDNNLNSESKEDEIKEDENNKFVEVDLNNTTNDETTSEKYNSFGAPIKNKQQKRNGNIFEYKLIRSRTVI